MTNPSLAVIFDMNGVILDDERVHQQAWKEFCLQHDFHLTEEEFKKKVFGRTEKETFEFLFDTKLSEAEVAQYSDERVEIAIKLIESSIEPIAGLFDFLTQLQSHAIPLGVATSSRKKYLRFVFEKLKLDPYFDVIVTAEDIAKGKPDPEIYLKAAQLLKVEPSNCVAFEDSLSGIKAAQAAGMKVVGVATTHGAEELTLADRVISNFNNADYGFVTSLQSV